MFIKTEIFQSVKAQCVIDYNCQLSDFEKEKSTVVENNLMDARRIYDSDGCFCNIRYANKEDADTLAFINSKSFQKAFEDIIPTDFLKEKFSIERLKDRLYKELNEGITKSCIMYKDEIPVGMLTFAKDDYKERDCSEIDIWRIYLLPEYWGKGIGIEFMDWAIKELKGQGYLKVALWVVIENKQALRFYEKFSFFHDGEIRVINVGGELKEYRYIRHLN
ncbi:MAG: GNAT family N-acetyltransferase [Clostridiaceae bacterium]|nr:GNAT family N-acetyltransferase [Clostridiaceae bacterium]